MNRILINESTSPWYNLALEELLFDDITQSSDVTLFLWQNRNTVVIGRHQNPWRECKTELLEKEGGKLARRTTGGGAVFHDTGNLNFSFVMPKTKYDLTRQLSVIITAVDSLGIQAQFTGRNDIVLSDGAKFSGNAFRFTRTAALHHGTILVDSDMTKLAKYLMPSQEKLRTHAVKSVRSRVKNLSEVNPTVNIARVRTAVMDAFVREYGVAIPLRESDFDQQRLSELESRNASWDWLYGEAPDFDVSFSKRFTWGGIEINFLLKGGITSATIYSDAMNEAFITALRSALTGIKFEPQHILSRIHELRGEYTEAEDVYAWLSDELDGRGCE